MAHDSYFCNKYPAIRTYPYLSQRRSGAGNFVGAIMTNTNSSTGFIPFGKYFECPRECRPKRHTDWKWC